MRLDLNLIFHKDVIEDTFVGLRHNHTAYFYKWLKTYKSQVDPKFNTGINYKVTYVDSYSNVDVLPNCVNVVFEVFQYPIWIAS